MSNNAIELCSPGSMVGERVTTSSISRTDSDTSRTDDCVVDLFLEVGLEDVSEAKFSVSCCGCRKSHLACDRLMPSCSECKMRGRSCQYVAPKKRGRVKGHKVVTTVTQKHKLSTIAPSSTLVKEGTKGKNGFHPYHPSQKMPQFDRNLFKESVNHAMINYFYDVVDVNFDLVRRDQMGEIVSNMHLFDGNYGVKTMLLAIQSLCEQSLSQPMSSSMSVRGSLHYSALSNPEDYCTKVSKALLAIFLVGDGEVELAKPYLQQLRTFHNVSNLDPCDTKKFIMIATKFEMFASTGDTDVESLEAIRNSFANFYSVKDGNTQNSFDLESIRKGVNLDNASNLLSLVHAVKDILIGLSKKAILSKAQILIKSISIELMYLSGVFTVLSALGFGRDQLEELIEKAELIALRSDILLPLNSFYYMAGFCYYRIHQFNSIRQLINEKLKQGRNIRSIFEEEEEKKYFEIALQYIKLVNSYTSRYRLVDKLFPKLVTELNTIVQWKFDMQMSCLSTSLTDDIYLYSEKKDSIDTTKEDTCYLSCFEKYKASNHIYSI